jgi:hypothetical protein
MCSKTHKELITAELKWISGAFHSTACCNRSHTIMSCANSSKLLLARCAGFVGLLSWSVAHLILSQGVFWLAVNQKRETTTLILNETQLENLNTYLLNCYFYIKVIGLHYYRKSKLIAERSAFVHLHKLYTIINSSDKQLPTGSWLSVCCHLSWITLAVCSDFFLLNPSDCLFWLLLTEPFWLSYILIVC